MVILQFYNYIVYHIHVKTLSGINFGGWNPETGVPREGAERVMKAQAGALNQTLKHELIHCVMN